MTATTRPVNRAPMHETFALRDDEAACEDCDWTRTWDPPRAVNRLMREASAHARREGHQVVVKRIQFHRYTGG